MASILILYYGIYGHAETMAEEVAEGALSFHGTEVTLKRVPDLVPEDVARKAGDKIDQPAAISTADELPCYDAIILGTPPCFGNVCTQIRNFLDQMGGLWFRGKMIGQVASAFTFTAVFFQNNYADLFFYKVTLYKEHWFNLVHRD